MADREWSDPEWRKSVHSLKPVPGKRMAEVDRDRLYLLHGKVDDTCRHCVFLERHIQGARWSKCQKARRTRSVASDWRAGWQACGLFQSKSPTKGRQ